MKRNFLFFVFILASNLLMAQYYPVPEWFSNIPASSSTCIYSIGISEPRMQDTALAKQVAINRAISVAAFLNNTTVSYSSDYFETKSEEYNTFILQETFQELAKFESAINYLESDYEVLQYEVNDNDETMVLIAFYPKQTEKLASVCGEYFRQDFEISNTRSLESISNLVLDFEAEEIEFKTGFRAVDVNNYLSFVINFDSIEIEPKGYYYTYLGVDRSEINQKAFVANSKLEKGLWNAFISAFYAGMIRKTKNYKSKMGISNDIYSTAVDNTPDIAQGSLSRQVSKNQMQFQLGGIVVDKSNMLHLSLLYPDEQAENFWINPPQNVSDNKEQQPKKKTCFLKRIFKRR